MNYTPPTTADLQRLKATLGFTGKQMAELAGLAGDQQWRKYTGGTDPREMSPHMAFFIAARMALRPEDLRTIGSSMQKFGAQVDLDELAATPKLDPTAIFHPELTQRYTRDAALAQAAASALRSLGDPYLVGAQLIAGAAEASREAARLLSEDGVLPVNAAKAAADMALAGTDHLKKVATRNMQSEAVSATNSAFDALELLRDTLRIVVQLDSAKDADRHPS